MYRLLLYSYEKKKISHSSTCIAASCQANHMKMFCTISAGSPQHMLSLMK